MNVINSISPNPNGFTFALEGIWLLYWPCTWSIGMASVQGSLPDAKLLMMFAVGAFLMRSSGCVCLKEELYYIKFISF